MESQLCRICLVTNVKMYNVQSPAIFCAYLELTGISDVSSYPHICYECVTRLLKCEGFRSKCFTAHDILTSVVSKDDIQRERKQKCLVSPLKKTNTIFFACNDKKQVQNVLTPTRPEVIIDETITIDSPNYELENNTNTAISAQDYDSDAFSDDECNSLTQRVSKRKFDQTIKSQVCKKPQKKLRTKKEKKTVNKHNKRLEVIQDLKSLEKIFTIVHLTTEDAKKEIELRKESKNYQNNIFKCTLCYRGFVHKNTFNNHMERHNLARGNIKCELCHVRFTSNRKYVEHMNRCHSNKFICKVCPYICFIKCQAKSHMNLHEGETYPCDECNQVFRFRHSLVGHKRLEHFSETTYVCALCGDAFTTSAGLTTHNRTYHSQDTNVKQGPQCVECDVHFATETAWKRHLVLSSKHQTIESKGDCDICGATFPDLNRLKKHLRFIACENDSTPKKMRMHNDVKSCVCEICGEIFKLPRHLEYHRIRHTRESPYKCDICGNVYVINSILEKHKIDVHSNTVYKCDICNKVFKNKITIARHIMRSHLNTRRHKCDICGKAFPFLCEVKYHKLHVHDNVPWPKRDRSKRNRTNEEQAD